MTKICSLTKIFRKTILNIKRILKMWWWRNLTLEGKIIIFKTLALSKITFLAQVSDIANQVIDALQQIQERFFMEFIFPKSETWNYLQRFLL